MKNFAFKNLNLPVSLKAGSVIFSAGEDSKYLVIVKSGQVLMFKKRGQHLGVSAICKEKQILNEVCVLKSKPNEFSAIAKTDVELVLVERKDILSVVKDGPSWVPKMFDTLCERLIATREIIEEHNLMAGEINPDMVISKDDEMKYLKALAEYDVQ